MKPVTYGKFTYQAHSVAGVFTSISCKELGLSFDVGNGAQHLFPIKHYLISHGHADHAAGLPYLLSMKSMMSQPTAQIYLPEAIVAPMQIILKQWQTIEGHEYKYQLHGISEGSEFELKGPYFARAFRTFHRVSSYGYTVFERKKKLKKSFQSLSREQILAAKEAEEEIHDELSVPIISFSGDSTMDFWDHSPWVKESKTLFVEVSFIDEKRSIAETREWGHIHLDEFLPRMQEFSGEHLVLIHLSQRYSLAQLEKTLDKKLPTELRKKVYVLPRTLSQFSK